MKPGVPMKEGEPRLAENDQVDGNPHWDIETITEQIWRDLGGVTPRAEIREALMEIAPLYENARVKSFVPIFLRRDVLQRLQNGVVQTHRTEKPKFVKG